MKKNICVYCSSSNHLEEKFYKQAQELGSKIALNGFNLVYGGSNRGSMGAVATAVIHHKGKATGVVPHKIQQMGISHPENMDLIMTKDMRERKATMENLSDVFIALPGGFGTFEEIFEIIVGKQLGYHKKAIVILNLDDFYNPMFQMFENVYKYNFIKEESRDLYHVTSSVDEAIDYILNYKEKEFALKW